MMTGLLGAKVVVVVPLGVDVVVVGAAVFDEEPTKLVIKMRTKMTVSPRAPNTITLRIMYCRRVARFRS